MIHYIPKGHRGAHLEYACGIPPSKAGPRSRSQRARATIYPEFVTCPGCMAEAASDAEASATEATAGFDTAEWARLDRIARDVRARAATA